MALTPTAGSVSVLGIAKETTPGTAVAPTYFLRVSKIDNQDKTTPLMEDTFQGDFAKNHQAVRGTVSSEISFTAPVALDTVGFALAGILNYGQYSGGTSPAPNTHLIALTTNAPATYTITDYSGVTTKVYAGCVFSDVEISGAADKLVEVTGKLVGYPSATGAAPAPSWTTELPVQTWNSTCVVGNSSATAATVYAEDWSVSFKRDVKPIFTASGSYSPSSVFGSTVEVTGKYTGVANGTGTTEIDNFVSTTARYIKIALNSPVSTSTEALSVELLNAVYEDGKIVRGNPGDPVKFDLSFRSIAAPTTFADAGLNSPAQITLLNAVGNNVLG